MQALQRVIRDESGFSIAEQLVAVMLVAVGLLGLVGGMDAARTLTTLSERKEAATQVAERELERLRTLDYDAIALTQAPATSQEDGDPRRDVTADGRYAWRQGTPEPIVIDAARGFPPGPETWDDGRQHGTIHRFVTWVDDPTCAVLCPGTNDYKRVTVAVTVDGPYAPRQPIAVHTLITDPTSGVADNVADGLLNPLEEPDTKCLEGGQWVECAGAIGGSALTMFPYDTDATVANVRQAIAGDHPVHATIAGLSATLCSLGITLNCPRPDLMGKTPPPVGPAGELPPLFRLSNDLAGNPLGGRVLRRDVGCSQTPTQANDRGGLWTTAPLAAATQLTGAGGMTLHTQTLAGVSAAAKICVRFYDVPNSLLNLIALPPTTLGTASFEAASWPRTPAPVTFSFDFSPGNVTVPANHRIGVRMWVDSSSGADLNVFYDHPEFPTNLQLTAAG